MSGRAVRAPDLQFGGPQFKSRSDLVDEFALGGPEFISSTMLLNSLLFCLRPVGILNSVKFDLEN